MERTEKGYRTVKDFAAGERELRALLSQPKMLVTNYYVVKSSSDRHLDFSDSMNSWKFHIELASSGGTGPIVYLVQSDTAALYSKTSEMRLLIEPVDDVKTRLTIDAIALKTELGEQMRQSAQYFAKEQLENILSIATDLTIFQSLIESAVQSNLPYVRDMIVVKGDYVQSKVDIRDSVLSRTNISMDTKRTDAYVRANSHIDSKVTITDSVVQRADISGGGDGGDGNIEMNDSVVSRTSIGMPAQPPEGLAAYRKALESAVKDGAVAPSQEAMLKVLRQRFGITQARHEEMLQEIADSKDINVATYLEVLKEAMRDGSVEGAEEDVLRSLRQSLGISEETHQRLMRGMGGK